MFPKLSSCGEVTVGVSRSSLLASHPCPPPPLLLRPRRPGRGPPRTWSGDPCRQPPHPLNLKKENTYCICRGQAASWIFASLKLEGIHYKYLKPTTNTTSHSYYIRRLSQAGNWCSNVCKYRAWVINLATRQKRANWGLLLILSSLPKRLEQWGEGDLQCNSQTQPTPCFWALVFTYFHVLYGMYNMFGHAVSLYTCTHILYSVCTHMVYIVCARMVYSVCTHMVYRVCTHMVYSVCVHMIYRPRLSDGSSWNPALWLAGFELSFYLRLPLP